MSPLRPCPFCGAAAELTHEEIGTEVFMAVMCSAPDCLAEIIGYAVDAEPTAAVVRMWNRRTTKEASK